MTTQQVPADVLQLARELEDVRARLDTAEAELAQLRPFIPFLPLLQAWLSSAKGRVAVAVASRLHKADL